MTTQTTNLKLRTHAFEGFSAVKKRNLILGANAILLGGVVSVIILAILSHGTFSFSCGITNDIAAAVVAGALVASTAIVCILLHYRYRRKLYNQFRESSEKILPLEKTFINTSAMIGTLNTLSNEALKEIISDKANFQSIITKIDTDYYDNSNDDSDMDMGEEDGELITLEYKKEGFNQLIYRLVLCDFVGFIQNINALRADNRLSDNGLKKMTTLIKECLLQNEPIWGSLLCFIDRTYFDSKAAVDDQSKFWLLNIMEETDPAKYLEAYKSEFENFSEAFKVEALQYFQLNHRLLSELDSGQWGILLRAIDQIYFQRESNAGNNTKKRLLEKLIETDADKFLQIYLKERSTFSHQLREVIEQNSKEIVKNLNVSIKLAKIFFRIESKLAGLMRQHVGSKIMKFLEAQDWKDLIKCSDATQIQDSEDKTPEALIEALTAIDLIRFQEVWGIWYYPIADLEYKKTMSPAAKKRIDSKITRQKALNEEKNKLWLQEGI